MTFSEKREVGVTLVEVMGAMAIFAIVITSGFGCLNADGRAAGYGVAGKNIPARLMICENDTAGCSFGGCSTTLNHSDVS
ncbi:MAG: hypothetical protein ACI8Z5_000820 [Lentimonas sp.]|jgi:hypothetical protein